MTLRQKQSKFVQMVGKLIEWAYANGYELTFGEAARTQEQASQNAATGKGISNSLHLIRLAVDFNLFVGGSYKTDTPSYKPLGEYWESIGGAWGGRFNDGNHFSLEHQGRK